MTESHSRLRLLQRRGRQCANRKSCPRDRFRNFSVTVPTKIRVRKMLWCEDQIAEAAVRSSRNRQNERTASIRDRSGFICWFS